VVNETFARRFWPQGTALGQRMSSGERTYEIVGIARDGKYLSLGEEPRPYMYFPALQMPGDVKLIVRTGGEPRALLDAARREVAAVPDIDVLNARTMDDRVAGSLLPQRIAGAALWSFGLLALLLAAIGLYGVVAYSVAMRTREIGVRIALGAPRQAVLSAVIRESLWLVVIGALIGLPAAWGVTRFIRGFLLGLSPADPLGYVAATLLLGAVTLVASWIPARRASRVDPMIALRTDV
jgi:predicted lysophospholipase L1 biosynthesis ABC-type transport system permease subunit